VLDYYRTEALTYAGLLALLLSTRLFGDRVMTAIKRSHSEFRIGRRRRYSKASRVSKERRFTSTRPPAS